MMPDPLLIRRRPGVGLHALLLLLCLPAASFAQGKGQGVEVRTVSPKLQEAVPGGILSVSFLVTNRTDGEEEFIESLQLPEGWQAIIPPGSFRLRASEATTRLVAFQVPRGEPAGRREVAYGVRSQRDYAIQDVDTVTVVVLPVTKLALLLEDKPESVIAGESYEVKLRLVNQSNVDLEVKLEVASEEKYPAKLEPAEVTLAAGQSVPLLVTVQTNAQEGRPRTHYVRVKAQGVEIDNGEVTAGITVGVEILPRVTGELDIYHRLPAELTVRLAGEESTAGVQVELRGEGPLDEEKTKSLEFLFRGPDIQDKGTFGWRDEYYLNYFAPDLDVHLGDQSYGLSQLTSYYRYGRGLGVDFHPPESATGFGAYYLEERWSWPDRQEGGAYITRRVNDKIETRLNFLRQDRDAYNARRSFHDTLWSLETEYKPTEDMKLQMEYARCDSNRRGDTEDDAYRIEWDGRLGQRGYYRAAKFHAEPDYYGYYNDSDHSYASLSYPLAPRLQGNISYNRYKRNLDLRPERRTADRETLWQGGVTYSLNKGWYLSLSYDDFERYDLFVPPAFDYSEETLQLGVGRSAEKYSFRVEVRTGDQEDHLTGESETLWNYSFFASYRPRRNTFFTLYAGFGDDKALGSGRLLRESNNLGASVAWQPRPDLDIDFWYTKYNFDSDDRSESDQYSLRVARRLPNSHRIALEVRHNTGDWWEDETSYMLAYTIPLGLPVAKKKNVGSIRGRVYDAEAPGQPGLPGVILRTNGATAVTNAKGEFIFPSAVPGTYQISVDRTSIGLERTTEQKMPLTVEVVGGESTEVDLGVVRAAQLSGKVLVMPANGNGNGNNGNGGNGNGNGANGNGNGAVVIGEPGNNKGRREPTGLANVLVELANGQEILRRITDQKGEFLFDSIRPGSWHLKVYDHNLPAYHYLETPEQDLTLEPGARAEITVRILPKVRQIKFIDEGVIQPNGNNH